jgi:hypothetical protein
MRKINLVHSIPTSIQGATVKFQYRQSLSVFALLCAVAHADSIDLTNAQIIVKDANTFAVIGAPGAGQKEQRFRWDQNSESFMRTGPNEDASCESRPFTKGNGVFKIAIGTSSSKKSMILILEQLQGPTNWPAGVTGIGLFQGKKWYALTETASAQGNNLYAMRIEPNTFGDVYLPIGGRAIYRVDRIPKEFDFGASVSIVASENQRVACDSSN